MCRYAIDGSINLQGLFPDRVDWLVHRMWPKRKLINLIFYWKASNHVEWHSPPHVTMNVATFWLLLVLTWSFLNKFPVIVAVYLHIHSNFPVQNLWRLPRNYESYDCFRWLTTWFHFNFVFKLLLFMLLANVLQQEILYSPVLSAAQTKQLYFFKIKNLRVRLDQDI